MSKNEQDLKDIINFIGTNKIATVCCTDGMGTPYCFNCFYVFEEKHKMLFFKSSTQATHSMMIANSSLVAGSILPLKIELMFIKGIQFTGRILSYDLPGDINPEAIYYKKLPLGLTKPGKVYCIELDMIKMTNSSGIISQKLLWNRLELTEGVI